MSHSASADDTQIFNDIRFQRMACGDLPGLFELAEEYFVDVRVKLVQWPGLLAAGEFPRLAEEFHRCKGGAAMFGLDRLFALLGNWEHHREVGQMDVDLERFESELVAAEEAVAGFRANAPNV